MAIISRVGKGLLNSVSSRQGQMMSVYREDRVIESGGRMVESGKWSDTRGQGRGGSYYDLEI
jgi:hypothetical protein